MHPVLFATDVERQEDIGVYVVLIDPVDGLGPSGHTSTHPVFSRRFAIPVRGVVTDDMVSQLRRSAVVEFGTRRRDTTSGPAGIG